MTLFQSSRKIFFKSRVLVLFLVLAFVASIITGCVTRSEVREIVTDSNASLMNSMISNNEDLISRSNASIVSSMLINNTEVNSALMPDGGIIPAIAPKPWEEPSAKIDTFIAANPDMLKAASALRVRQAMLLLSHKQYNMARAAFKMVQMSDLHVARDTALYILGEPLIWWFSLNKVGYGVDFDLGAEHLKAFQTEIDKLDESPAIRDYLAEMRAWIALLLAEKTGNKSDCNEYLKDGIDNYSKIFTDEDITTLATGKYTTKPSSIETRRILRAKLIIKQAKNVITNQRITAPQFGSKLGGFI